MTDITRDLLISLASHMSYMQGQLEARHDPDEDDLEDCYWYAESVALRQMVSDALAGEPAAVIGQPRPMDEDWDALVNRLWSKYETIGCQGERFMYEGDFCTALDLVRQEIAHWGNPAPLPPADGEVAELAAWLQEEADDYECIGCEDSAAKCKRAAELLQRQVVVPVSVSERPWEREGWCDVEGRFWAEHISRSGVASWRCAAASDLGGWAVRCLPAHALPQPEVGE